MNWSRVEGGKQKQSYPPLWGPPPVSSSGKDAWMSHMIKVNFMLFKMQTEGSSHPGLFPSLWKKYEQWEAPPLRPNGCKEEPKTVPAWGLRDILTLSSQPITAVYQ